MAENFGIPLLSLEAPHPNISDQMRSILSMYGHYNQENSKKSFQINVHAEGKAYSNSKSYGGWGAAQIWQHERCTACFSFYHWKSCSFSKAVSNRAYRVLRNTEGYSKVNITRYLIGVILTNAWNPNHFLSHIFGRFDLASVESIHRGSRPWQGNACRFPQRKILWRSAFVGCLSEPKKASIWAAVAKRPGGGGLIEKNFIVASKKVFGALRTSWGQYE